MAQVRPVTSESLESKVRTLLPSQVGFGEDLQASNVILPIIDLTTAAENSTPEFLQTALAFGSQTNWSAVNSTDTIVNTPGFYRIYGCVAASSATAVKFEISDGFAVKVLWQMNATNTSETVDFVVFLRSGDSVTVTSTTATGVAVGTSRQIADVNGNLVNPVGFSPQ